MELVLGGLMMDDKTRSVFKCLMLRFISSQVKSLKFHSMLSFGFSLISVLDHYLFHIKIYRKLGNSVLCDLQGQTRAYRVAN